MHILLAIFLLAQYVHRSNPGVPGGIASALTAAGAAATCPGSSTGTGCLGINTSGASSVLIKISGTWVATISFRCTQDAWTTTMNMTAFPVTNGILGTGILTTTTTGTWLFQTNSYPLCGVYADAFTSQTSMAVILDADPDDALIGVTGIPGGAPVATTPPLSSTAGTQIACNAGVSPCTVTTAALTILNANTSRRACQLCAWDVVDLYCKRNTSGGSAASVTNADFALNAGAAAKKIGGCWSCDTSGTVWQGAVNCIASAASAVTDLTVSETN